MDKLSYFNLISLLLIFSGWGASLFTVKNRLKMLKYKMIQSVVKCNTNFIYSDKYEFCFIKAFHIHVIWFRAKAIKQPVLF